MDKMKKDESTHMTEDKNQTVSNQSEDDSLDSTSDLMLEDDWDEEQTAATGSLGGERELYEEDDDYLVSSTSPRNKEEMEEVEEDETDVAA